MTLQEIFTMCAEHMISTGEKCLDDRGNPVLYSSPDLTDPAGFLILTKLGPSVLFRIHEETSLPDARCIRKNGAVNTSMLPWAAGSKFYVDGIRLLEAVFLATEQPKPETIYLVKGFQDIHDNYPVNKWAEEIVRLGRQLGLSAS